MSVILNYTYGCIFTQVSLFHHMWIINLYSGYICFISLRDMSVKLFYLLRSLKSLFKTTSNHIALTPQKCKIKTAPRIHYILIVHFYPTQKCILKFNNRFVKEKYHIDIGYTIVHVTGHSAPSSQVMLETIKNKTSTNCHVLFR